MTRSWEIVVTLVLFCSLFVCLVSGTAQPTAAHDTPPQPSVSADQETENQFVGDPAAISPDNVEIDRTVFAFTVDEDGDARWLFEFRLQLESDQDVQNFRQFAQFFRTNETTIYDEFRSRALSLVRSANRSIDRNMTARSFGRDATVEKQLAGDVGVLRIRFNWTNFARVTESGIIRVGDVFEGQLFIDQNHSLRLVAGDGLRFRSVEPEATVMDRETLAESTRLTWEGRREFADGRPRAVLVPVGYEDNSAGGGTDGEQLSGGSSSLLAVGGLFVFAIVAVTVALWHRDQLPVEYPAQLPGKDSSSSPPQLESSATQQPPPVGEDTTDAPTPAEPSIPDEELLSDEDRVQAMLEKRGGRMKQVKIVEETGWSKSKVSMLLSDMEEEGTISKIRIGRENIIALDGEEPDAASSPFEDA